MLGMHIKHNDYISMGVNELMIVDIQPARTWNAGQFENHTNRTLITVMHDNGDRVTFLIRNDGEYNIRRPGAGEWADYDEIRELENLVRDGKIVEYAKMFGKLSDEHSGDDNLTYQIEQYNAGITW